ncbi:MAG: riboflavin biosynthesis protein RibF [Thioalkalivibrionaceae bacterium]
MSFDSTRWLHGACPGTPADRAAMRGACVTIGNYDGLHRGHLEILRRMGAAAEGRPLVLVGFNPTPREFFAGDAAMRLTRWRDRASVLDALRAERICVDAVWLQRFDSAMAHMRPEDFIYRLVAAIAPTEVWVGDDFRFGRDRSGDAALLERSGAAAGFVVRRTPTVVDECGRISSTRVRDALERADFDSAAALLGRRYALHGRVAHGERRGRTIGFPTLNVRLGSVPMVLRGVYAGEVRFCDAPSMSHPAIANIGVRPTVDGREQRLEAHVLGGSMSASDLVVAKGGATVEGVAGNQAEGFVAGRGDAGDRNVGDRRGFDDNAVAGGSMDSGGQMAFDAYGRRLAFVPVAKIRNEQRFDGLAALRAQIGRDVAAAHALWAGGDRFRDDPG